MARKKKTKSADKQPQSQSRVVAENRRARHRFEISEKLECGIALVGSEVKSLRHGHVSLEEAYVRVNRDELWLIGANISEYRQANMWNHDQTRARKLLVHRRQLNKLASRAYEKGMTLVPLKIYFNERGIVKVLIGVGRGKKIHDKRESLKKADDKRRIERSIRARSGR